MDEKDVGRQPAENGHRNSCPLGCRCRSILSPIAVRYLKGVNARLLELDCGLKCEL